MRLASQSHDARRTVLSLFLPVVRTRRRRILDRRLVHQRILSLPSSFVLPSPLPPSPPLFLLLSFLSFFSFLLFSCIFFLLLPEFLSLVPQFCIIIDSRIPLVSRIAVRPNCQVLKWLPAPRCVSRGTRPSPPVRDIGARSNPSPGTKPKSECRSARDRDRRCLEPLVEIEGDPPGVIKPAVATPAFYREIGKTPRRLTLRASRK